LTLGFGGGKVHLMTPTQLKAFAAVVRLGSARAAAEELGVSEAAVSGHIASLRKQLDDQLFTKSGGELAFTPGGLRLARRAMELLGLQDQTVSEVQRAASGKRVLQIAVSPIFGEYAAPGLIELFAKRADDLDVEMNVTTGNRFVDLLESRAIDAAFGPAMDVPTHLQAKPLLRYQLVAVAGAGHRLAGRRVGQEELAQARWCLGPAATDATSTTYRFLADLGVPEGNQMVFQSQSAAINSLADGEGVTLAPAHRVAKEVESGRLIELDSPGARIDGVWTGYGLGQHTMSDDGKELLRFALSPRALQAMLAGSAANVSRFKPQVHVTLWSS
jgi:DNA-binding transcriptional LysR family regulator